MCWEVAYRKRLPAPPRIFGGVHSQALQCPHVGKQLPRQIAVRAQVIMSQGPGSGGGGGIEFESTGPESGT